MRKNTTIYNHKRFAQVPEKARVTQNRQAPGSAPNSAPKINFKDPAHINKLLATQNPAQNLVFLAIRSEIGDQKISTFKDKPAEYDKEVFTVSNINKFDSFFQSLKKIKGIDSQSLNKIEPDFKEILRKKLESTGNAQETSAPSNAANPASTANPNVPQAPSVVAPAAANTQPQITPEQADKYLSNILTTLSTLSQDKEKPGAFTQRYSNEYNYIINAMGILRNDPKFFSKLEGYNKSLNDLAPVYNNAMHPTGWTAAGNSVFVTDWYTLGDQIIKDLQSTNFSSAKDKLTTFQNEFLNKNPKNTDISEVANKVNQFVDQYNTSGIGISNKVNRLR